MTWQTVFIGAGLLIAARYVTGPLIRFVSGFADDSGFLRREAEPVAASDATAGPDKFGTAAIALGLVAIAVFLFPPATVVLAVGAMVMGFIAERRAMGRSSRDRVRAEVGAALGVFALGWGGLWLSVWTALSSGSPPS